MASRPSRPALLPLDHPLCYSTSKHRQQIPEDSSEISKTCQNNGAEDKDLGSLLQRVLDRQDIVNLLNEYAYVLDTVMVNPEATKDWAELFTLDCSVTYPFGHFAGRASLPDMCLEAETRFERMIVSMISAENQSLIVWSADLGSA